MKGDWFSPSFLPVANASLLKLNKKMKHKIINSNLSFFIVAKLEKNNEIFNTFLMIIFLE